MFCRAVAVVRAGSCHRRFASSSFIDVYNDVRNHAETHHTIKVARLTQLFKAATTKRDVIDAVQVLRLFETRYIEPVQETAGEFIKKCIQVDAGDVALKVFQNHSRLGLHVNTGSLNKLLVYFYDKKEFSNVLSLYREMKAYEVKFNKDTYNVAIRVQLLQFAATKNEIKRYTCNYVLMELVKRGLHDKVEIVAKCMTTYGIAANDTTKHLAGPTSD
ncbi:hypothetical protein SPRG_18835 [Saprolegnia parasitica CBS 223.65]|uniref:Pentacotripeptide-repeat region of PRORP domain-containing protein n=1 Tax=Saprolegnia parasitica (strain CBS 223.65) TaxID=695850 RepID=A0A067D2I3_SAPPC|nr:hypothetical protein SPRG_18835 [Saprolegnia parasitica CBS 223.65]KDO35675.1 hypothetical protein SPRG_18835 [Saprolegnia parasitica CBS 223.65]|eukprot:XP_012194051.1 hypothetical protein SPRG_18835 [Saprolegnia parasitica CBS 223.65]